MTTVMASAPWKSPVIPWKRCSENRKNALRKVWATGDLEYKLHPSQVEVYRQIKASWATVNSSLERLFALDMSRQYGKDHLCAVLAVEVLYQHWFGDEPTYVPYGAPTRKSCKSLLMPTLAILFEDCPPELRPAEIADESFVRSADTLTLPGGRQTMSLIGCDLYPNRMRGNAVGAIFVSEAGFMDISLVLGIALPSLLTRPNGFAIVNSSPSPTPVHEWETEVIPAAKSRGMHATRNIYDNPMLGDDQRNGAITAMGGAKAIKCRRELFCEHIADDELTVVPEWPSVRGELIDGQYVGGVVVDRAPPKYRDCYVAMDPGWSDLCAVLFAYWDFERACLVVEDDFAVARANSEVVARMIREKEAELWGKSEGSWTSGKMKPAPYRRVSDTDLRMIGDMTTIHNLPFQPTRKDDRDAAINGMRVRIGSSKIEVNPRAKNTIAHLDHAIWNKQRTEFERSGKNGHFDALAALVYLDRNIDRNKSPLPPALYGIDTSNMLILPHQRMNTADPVTKMFPGVAAKFKETQRRQRGRMI